LGEFGGVFGGVSAAPLSRENQKEEQGEWMSHRWTKIDVYAKNKMKRSIMEGPCYSTDNLLLHDSKGVEYYLMYQGWKRQNSGKPLHQDLCMDHYKKTDMGLDPYFLLPLENSSWWSLADLDSFCGELYVAPAPTVPIFKNQKELKQCIKDIHEVLMRWRLYVPRPTGGWPADIDPYRGCTLSEEDSSDEEVLSVPMVVPAKKYYADDHVHVASLRYHFWKAKVRAAQLMGITPISRGTRAPKAARTA
jgi:hypothetical protein